MAAAPWRTKLSRRRWRTATVMKCRTYDDRAERPGMSKGMTGTRGVGGVEGNGGWVRERGRLGICFGLRADRAGGRGVRANQQGQVPGGSPGEGVGGYGTVGEERTENHGSPLDRGESRNQGAAAYVGRAGSSRRGTGNRRTHPERGRVRHQGTEGASRSGGVGREEAGGERGRRPHPERGIGRLVEEGGGGEEGGGSQTGYRRPHPERGRGRHQGTAEGGGASEGAGERTGGDTSGGPIPNGA